MGSSGTAVHCSREADSCYCISFTLFNTFICGQIKAHHATSVVVLAFCPLRPHRASSSVSLPYITKTAMLTTTVFGPTTPSSKTLRPSTCSKSHSPHQSQQLFRHKQNSLLCFSAMFTYSWPCLPSSVAGRRIVMSRDTTWRLSHLRTWVTYMPSIVSGARRSGTSINGMI